MLESCKIWDQKIDDGEKEMEVVSRLVNSGQRDEDENIPIQFVRGKRKLNQVVVDDDIDYNGEDIHQRYDNLAL